MARMGWVPEFSSPPIQRRIPDEPEWTPQQLAAMDTIHAELVEEHIVEPIQSPDLFDPRVQLAAAAAMCYYAGTPFLVPAMILPYVHVMFAVPKPHSTKWRGVSGLSMFNQFVTSVT